MKIFKLVNNRTKIVELEILGSSIHDNGDKVWNVKNEFGDTFSFFERYLDNYMYFSSAENAIKILIKEHLQRIIRIDEERNAKINELEYSLHSTLDLVSLEERNNILLKFFDFDSKEANILSESSDKSINLMYLNVLLDT